MSTLEFPILYILYNYIFIREYASATQAIWAETKEVGCGRARFGKGAQRKFIIVCNYGPKGNVEKSQIFKKGKGCSSCPNGLSCNKEYPSLCGRVNNHRFDHWKPPFGKLYYRFQMKLMESSRNYKN